MAKNLCNFGRKSTGSKYWEFARKKPISCCDLAGTQLSVTASSAENQLSLTGLHCENLFLAFSQHKFSLIESLGDNLFSVAESYAFC